ncbi:unnamed protein product [Closterium sp. Naga37s-1]|nr:unnamed protein product [Closterium sp. Naga37s-1]
MAGSTDLTKQVEALLEDPSQTILMAMKLSKNQASWTVAGRRGRLQSKPRILAIGVRRKENTGKQKPKIHIIKPGPQGLELLKSYRLGALTSIELVTSDTTGRSFLLVFDEKTDSSQPQWTTRTVDDRNQLVFLLLKMCKDYLKTLPKVIGLDVVDLALWAKKNAKSLPGGARLTEEGEGEAVGVESESMMAQDSLVSKVEEEDMEALLGTFKVGVDGEAVGVESELMMAQDSLVSKVEEEDMEALLGIYVIGIDEAEAFSERLKRELGALEAANVHAILESEALVEEVVDSLDEAAGRVEDMENWLNVFNVKLKHMRDDIESIEAQNNMLEMQAKNNKKLLEELETLLESLYIPPQCIRVLSSGSLDEQAMPNTLEAVGWLVDAVKKLEPPQLDQNYVNMRAPAMPNTLEAVGWLLDAVNKLEPPQLDQNYVNMRAVREKKAELDSLKNGFVRRATDFIRSFISSTVEAAAELDPNVLDNIRRTYIHSLNMLLRREISVHRRVSQPRPAQLHLLWSRAALPPFDCMLTAPLLPNLPTSQAREFSTDLRASARVSAKTSTAPPFLEQGSAALPPAADSQAASDAFAKMLRAFLPLISEEGLFFQQFLCFSPAADDDEEPLSEEDAAALAAAAGQLLEGMSTPVPPSPHSSPPADEDAAALAAAAEQLFEGIHEDFVAMVEWVFKVDPLRCITLVGHTEAWQQQQQQLQLQHGADAGGCGAVITRKLLLELETRIRQNFFRYVEEANGRIERYDRGVKQAGVLLYVPYSRLTPTSPASPTLRLSLCSSLQYVEEANGQIERYDRGVKQAGVPLFNPSLFLPPPCQPQYVEEANGQIERYDRGVKQAGVLSYVPLLLSRLKSHYYVEEANGQIERYDRGVKQAGVLSYVPRFAALAVRMEGLVMGSCRDLVDQAYNKLHVKMAVRMEGLVMGIVQRPGGPGLQQAGEAWGGEEGWGRGVGKRSGEEEWGRGVGKRGGEEGVGEEG